MTTTHFLTAKQPCQTSALEIPSSVPGDGRSFALTNLFQYDILGHHKIDIINAMKNPANRNRKFVPDSSMTDCTVRIAVCKWINKDKQRSTVPDVTRMMGLAGGGIAGLLSIGIGFAVAYAVKKYFQCWHLRITLEKENTMAGWEILDQYQSTDSEGAKTVMTMGDICDMFESYLHEKKALKQQKMMDDLQMVREIMELAGVKPM